MRLHWIAASLVAAGGAVAAHLYGGLDPVLSWLASVNAAALLVYGYDKAIAGSDRSRVPERLLLAMAMSGGSVGAYVGMQVFRHKTSKASFRWRFWLVVVLQVALVWLLVLCVEILQALRLAACSESCALET